MSDALQVKRISKLFVIQDKPLDLEGLLSDNALKPRSLIPQILILLVESVTAVLDVHQLLLEVVLLSARLWLDDLNSLEEVGPDHWDWDRLDDGAVNG